MGAAVGVHHDLGNDVPGVIGADVFVELWPRFRERVSSAMQYSSLAGSATCESSIGLLMSMQSLLIRMSLFPISSVGVPFF